MEDDFKDFAEYIWNNYKGKRVIEVGIGPDSRVFKNLSDKGLNIIATDVLPRHGVFLDDISKPNEEIYRGAGLIYSIRPPPELYSHLRNLARRVGSDLIIKPLSTDSSVGGKLVNYKKANFILFQKACAR